MKYVYMFPEGNGQMRELLGGKGANLAEMTGLGMPVPQGFTITTEACTRYYEDGKTIAPDIQEQIVEYLAKLEQETGKTLGDPARPLLVSVRSGARASMPGMMDTILNLGMNDEICEAVAGLTSNPRFARDSYRRFIQMFSDVVMELPKSSFEQFIDQVKEEKGVKHDNELDADDMSKLIVLFKEHYKKSLGEDFPQDPRKQLMEAVRAVFRSWDNPRANTYRRMNDIPHSWGTAVNVQSMVFGNMGDTSGTGVAFTRNPATGEKKLYGEFLMNAQGEDVVAGIRTPQPISSLADTMPEVYQQFVDISSRLEQHYGDMQDMEFTIENGKLYMLQTRNGKRTAQAALKVAVDLVEEGVCTKEQAMMKVEAKQLDSLLHPTFVPAALAAAKPITSGLPASPGAACGAVYFTAEEAAAAHKSGAKVVLVRQETSPEDIDGMAVSEGIMTARGGMTSHAAVVARGMGTCCVAGVNGIKVSEENKTLTFADGTVVKEGDFLSLDGSTGNVYLGKIDTQEAELTGDFGRFMSWADEIRTLKVRTNADTPRDATQARKFGAEGIGLCRTEHMFFEPARIKAVREMIVSDTVEQRKAALAKILPMQRGDFEAIYRAMGTLPVTIRLLDPPLHEFLPHEAEEIRELAGEMGVPFEKLAAKVADLHEFNPMLGTRGCRLDVLYPEIAEMQTEAIISAAINVTKEDGLPITPEIMVPLVSEINELRFVKQVIKAKADELIAAAGVDMKYLVGTMIETPRAAVTSDQIAQEAEFFSFGTNDLTQMTYGFSRDDIGRILETYFDKKILESDPFARLDQDGVGRLVKMAVDNGKKVRPNIKLGICGEHGGDLSSVEFCHNVGLNYVSCSPFRVPIARLAAAQARVKELGKA
ncbi:MAG: pyruvate, phosphate dikinase [Agathobaculum sp.]|uniref:pyruvate, phosphate dikinase n=1 Tax=Agathobaculum sp. TaxID=2048138 RepID=UPI0025BC845D|nr:pyruvate, phosphate dikinase [Agathobaculum sp.]MCI7126064.1 pyruvate, phosphate dikinase [Agathobaculum sp.]MDY3711496.1 pyruvate, phosphate dikinase [Agathobaculum sp.]